MSVAPATFYKRVEQALGDQRLQGAMDSAMARLQEVRNTSFNAFADGEAVRDHARHIRAHTLSRLDEYLDQFTRNVEARGGTVFYAHTAADAIRYVCDLARARGVQSVVKSKSMVTEELELNGYLESAGVTVVETDLGEWVVQLAHDHPSHIVAPIIHLKREDIAKLFKEKADATDEEVADVPQMTAFARRMLRRAFLQADMGISGVNFAVAETGAVTICTNEGNGRLTTTLPRIHVAMMGIERIVPTMEDLGVVLQVLARSATGQKLTVYTNMLSGPRRPGVRNSGDGASAESARESAGENELDGEPDGPEELHVVMLDNGRSKLLGGELAEILYCIRCGACLNICPVYQEIGGHAYGTVYPGPVGAVLTPGLRGLAQFHELPNASSLCGACREVCPVRIDIPRMLLKLREEATHDPATRAIATPWWLRVGLRGYQWMAMRPGLFRFAGRAGGVVTRLLAREGWIRRLPGPLGGWTQSRDFPAMPAKSFTQRWQERSGRS
jgi:L-lactate dehydrogenase complex protein LldF